MALEIRPPAPITNENDLIKFIKDDLIKFILNELKETKSVIEFPISKISLTLNNRGRDKDYKDK